MKKIKTTYIYKNNILSCFCITGLLDFEAMHRDDTFSFLPIAKKFNILDMSMILGDS